MSDIAIRVEGLSKQYKIGETLRYKTLRDSITDTLLWPFKLLRESSNGKAQSRNYAQASPKGTVWALKDVSFDVKKGDVVGIIGGNGAGKTTLLKILSRITDPTEGSTQIRGRVGALLEVGTGFHPELTGRENIFLNAAIMGMPRADIKRKFNDIVDFSGVEEFIDTPVKRYSSGMYVRLAFSVAAYIEPEIFLVDEVLAVGDAAFQKKCMGKMGDVASEGRTVIFVSHNMSAITKLCSRAIVLKHGQVFFEGNTDEAVNKYLHDIIGNGEGTQTDSKHILFNGVPGDEERRDCRITKIEILEPDGGEKPMVYTWDNFVIRVHFSSKRSVKNGAVVLEIKTIDGTRVLLFSTTPDSHFPMDFEVGEHYVDCVIEQLPLTSGDYIVGAALEIPYAETLWYRPEVGKFTILNRDVFESGLAPTTSRALFAIPHHWKKSF